MMMMMTMTMMRRRAAAAAAAGAIPSLLLLPSSAPSLLQHTRRSFANVQLFGVVGKDPEFRATTRSNNNNNNTHDPQPQQQPTDEAAASQTHSQSDSDLGYWRFPCASDRSVKRNGQWQHTTTWYNVSVYSSSSDNRFISGRISKGAKVFVDGRLEVYKNETSMKTYVDVITEKVHVLTPPKTVAAAEQQPMAAMEI